MLTHRVAVTFEPCTTPIESDMLTLCVAVTDYTNSRVDTGVRGADGRKISSNPTIEELKRKLKFCTRVTSVCGTTQKVTAAHRCRVQEKARVLHGLSHRCRVQEEARALHGL